MSNRDAFLTMLAMSEGTAKLGDNGYNVLVGGKLFGSYADHPRVKVWIEKLNEFSSAAGRYQILERTFDAYKTQLGLDDFSPASQDAIALELIKERHALDSIDAGLFDLTVFRCSNIWASLPFNTYGQRQNDLIILRQFYTNAGGIIESADVPTS